MKPIYLSAGIATMVLMATSKYVFKFGGWIAAALATPLSIILSGGIFFASAIAMQGGAGALGPNVSHRHISDWMGASLGLSL
jgi:ATP/ADP translocase